MGSVSVSSCRSCMFVYAVLVCHQYDVCCEIYVGSVYIGRYGGMSKSGLFVFSELCPVSFLVVCECSSVLL